ncbi:MAG: beta-lactamase family protein [Armatimonadetes bacterium]|nr:beta-lactamase family protein [Armatimonadota bacterium]
MARSRNLARCSSGRSALLLSALVLAPATARADKVDDLVLHEMKKSGVPGMSVAVIRNGKVIKLKGYGYANVEHQIKVTPSTVFEIGSVGKLFTASLVMKLVEAGKVKLDESIRTYLPEAPMAWDKVTVRHMLAHTSGIPRDFPNRIDRQTDITEAELIKTLRDIPLEFAPGEKWSYSNVGYVTLGYMCSKVSGKPRGELLSELLFKPAGMATARIISDSEIVKNRAAGYFINDGKFLNQPWEPPTSRAAGSSGVYVSLTDMVKWNAALDEDKVLSSHIKKQMWASGVLKDGSKTDYGFGWMVPVINGHTYMGHSGGMPGFAASYRRFPDDHLAVIVLANSNTPDPHRLSRKIATLYVPDVRIVPPAAVPDTAPALTAALIKLLDGDDAIPAQIMTPAMQEVWTKKQVAEFSKDLRAYGQRTLIEPIAMNKEAAVYRVKYGKTTLIITLVLDEKGRVQGSGVEEED